MKTIKFMTILCLLLVAVNSCKDDDNKAWNNEAPVYFTGHDKEGNKSVNQQRMTAHDVLAWAKSYDENNCLVMGSDQCGFVEVFAQDMGNVDTINNRVKFPAGRIIWDGELNENWLPYRNWIIFKDSEDATDGDTVAYIPNAQLDFAEDTIRKLYAKGDYETIYKVFETAFQFIPCTGAEFKELKEKGLN